MNVYFDYQIFYLQKYGGISRYFYELAKHLNDIHYCEAQIIAPFNQNAYLLSKESEHYCKTIYPFLKKLSYNRFVDKRVSLNEYFARIACQRHQPSILHETYYTHRFKVKSPKVITIHDMIYELFASDSQVDQTIINNKKQAILEADKIIAVSQSTKNDLLAIYPQVKNKVHVVYHGITPINTEVIVPFTNTKPYILFVGNRDWYKNFKSLLEVYAQAKEIHIAFDLICFGGQAFTADELEFINKHNLFSQIKYLKGSDELLNQLYKGASVLAYLSRYEGFGLPVLEALRFACPVICSNGSSLPEVAGSLAQLINVEEKQEIEMALKNVLFNAVSDTNIEAQAKDWVNSFTWDKCAEETHNVYSSLLK